VKVHFYRAKGKTQYMVIMMMFVELKEHRNEARMKRMTEWKRDKK